jgi:hypothetical protein
MSLLESLKTKYPGWKVISEPDPECKCKGTGQHPTRADTTPCLCVCLGTDPVYSRVELCRAVGAAAKKALEEWNL